MNTTVSEKDYNSWVYEGALEDSEEERVKHTLDLSGRDKKFWNILDNRKMDSRV